MKATWCVNEGRQNFGDLLTPELFRRLLGVELERAEPESAELIGVGSILLTLPPVGWRGTVWGTGMMHASGRMDLSAANVLALRGPLTLERVVLSRPRPVLADPGLLVHLLAPSRQDHGTIVWAPHYADPRPSPIRDAETLDVTGGVDLVLAALSSAHRVATSSLHVLIAADALGLERMWTPSRAVLGDGFKFRDYAGSIAQTLRPGEWQKADPLVIAARQAELLDTLHSIPVPVPA